MRIAESRPFEGKPIINIASVYGGCTGKDINCRIPIIGKRPIRIMTEGLPDSLNLENGVIRGAVAQDCEFTVRIVAENALGTTEKAVTFKIADDNMLQTPLMGFTSWNAFGSGVSQEKLEKTADLILEKGIADYGYQYMNIDSGWQKEYGGEYYAVMPNDKFPDMKGYCDRMHEKGLKCGIYSTPMLNAWGCPDEFESIPGCTRGEPSIYYTHRNGGIGTERLEANNVKQWEAWGFDYLKYDWEPCEPINAEYMKKELRKANREIAFCVTVDADLCYERYWKKNCCSWRCNRDSLDEWNRVVKRLFPTEVSRIEMWKQAVLPGHFYDLDMLEIGPMVWNEGQTRLTENEAIFAYTLRAFFASPIQLSCVIDKLNEFEFNLVTNEEMIGINQDSLADFPELFYRDEEDHLLVFKRTLENGDEAFAVFNTTQEEITHILDFGQYSAARDLWTKTDLTADKEFACAVEPHCVRVFRVKK